MNLYFFTFPLVLCKIKFNLFYIKLIFYLTQSIACLYILPFFKFLLNITSDILLDNLIIFIYMILYNIIFLYFIYLSIFIINIYIIFSSIIPTMFIITILIKLFKTRNLNFSFRLTDLKDKITILYLLFLTIFLCISYFYI